MCCTQLAENTGRNKSPKIRHLGSVAQLCRNCWAVSLQLRHVLTIGKNLLNSSIFSKRPHIMVKFGPLVAEVSLPVWAPQQISTGLTCWLRYCPDVAQRTSTIVSQTLHDVWPSPWLVHYIYFFWGSCP